MRGNGEEGGERGRRKNLGALVESENKAESLEMSRYGAVSGGMSEASGQCGVRSGREYCDGARSAEQHSKHNAGEQQRHDNQGAAHPPKRGCGTASC